MDLVMDHGWIVTDEADGLTKSQVSVACEGGSGTSVPDLSIEVDNLDEVYRYVSAAEPTVEYGPKTEPWGAFAAFTCATRSGGWLIFSATIRRDSCPKATEQPCANR